MVFITFSRRLINNPKKKKLLIFIQKNSIKNNHSIEMNWFIDYLLMDKNVINILLLTVFKKNFNLFFVLYTLYLLSFFQ